MNRKSSGLTGRSIFGTRKYLLRYYLSLCSNVPRSACISTIAFTIGTSFFGNGKFFSYHARILSLEHKLLD
ncbi:hypothetical protein PTT_08808 [Pyrenophora teres f. teres 0-1]|uniref:Uncharacterized protein n=1 Tax=Pyrenophora teres f. teres (strain 0-1) TaxID=861557 RepID=E3RKN4_PYRTT|nr:hypothetical protein PTT_08808 [Pyrenophora teres f. teres 0-1]